jgi:phosphate transport system protein
MQEHFTQEIENLQKTLIYMASMVDEQVNRAFKSLETGDMELCRGLKAKDVEVDLLENLIKTECENILALFQPVAVDLRYVISALTINYQLERCGDIAVNIFQRVKKIVQYQDLIKECEILEMGRHAKDMLKNAIDSFINNDSETAGKVIVNDEIVDKYNKKIFKFLVAKMQAEPSLIEPCAHLIVVSRNIERLADHATNIAEDLIFYIDAKIVAHQKKLKDRNSDEN